MIQQPKTVRMPSESGPAVVTPKLWGGYELPAIAGKIRPVYHPALNQVWIDRSSLPEPELMLAFAHEAMHAHTIILQPAQLTPLRAELLGYIDRPNEKCFDDIVETVCEASFLGRTRLGVDDIELMFSEAKYPEMLTMLFELAKRLAGRSPSHCEGTTRLKEAIMGLCLLLMHIAPHQAKLGQAIMQRLSRFPTPAAWQDQRQVFLYYYAELHKEWEQSGQLQEQMTLVLPIDTHRCVADMVLFLSAALKVVNYRPETVTAVLPTLLLLATQGSFMLMPIIFLVNTRRQLKVEITVVHTTSRSMKMPNRVMDLHRRIDTRAKGHDVICSAIPVFIALMETSLRFASCNGPNRISDCFQVILQTLPNLFKEHLPSNANCEGCRRIFQGEIFCSALETVMSLSRVDCQATVRAANNYEQFLLKDMSNIVQDTWELPETPRAIRRYKFL